MPKRWFYSGTCLCGHSWRYHHCCCIVNPEVVKIVGADVIPDECNYFGCNELGGLDEEGELHCGCFCDSEDPNEETKARWKGTKR